MGLKISKNEKQVLWKTLIYVPKRCLKITEKVSFNIASEASYVYILSGQKLIKKGQKMYILAGFWSSEDCGQTVLPDRKHLIEDED